jgi:hypothetical protein
MRARLLHSLLVALVALAGVAAWWTDEDVARRRRAWLDAHVPAWAWELPRMTAVLVSLASLPFLAALLVYAWVQWVRFG